MVDRFRWKIENMKQDVVYTRDTPFIEYLVDLRRIGFCGESSKLYEEAYRKHPELTLSEIIKQYPPKQGWAKSMLTVYDGKLDEDIRKLYMDLVKDDVMNYRLWKKLVNITDQEREMLHAKFRGKLPNIERKL